MVARPSVPVWVGWVLRPSFFSSSSLVGRPRARPSADFPLAPPPPPPPAAQALFLERTLPNGGKVKEHFNEKMFPLLPGSQDRSGWTPVPRRPPAPDAPPDGCAPPPPRCEGDGGSCLRSPRRTALP